MPGPLLTAEIRDLQFNSDRTQVSFELRFSEEFALSYVTLRDEAFTVSGGEVVGARRLDKQSNLRYPKARQTRRALWIGLAICEFDERAEADGEHHPIGDEGWPAPSGQIADGVSQVGRGRAG